MSIEHEWVELCRFDAHAEAEITVGFLRDHGITASLRGGLGATAVFGHVTGGVDIRLVVPAREFDAALEALEALHVAEGEEVLDPPDGTGSQVGTSPYRASIVHVPTDCSLDRRVARYEPIAFMLALLVPIGAGHHYARHGAAGNVFCGAIAACALGAMVGGAAWLATAAVLLALTDGVGGAVAVRRLRRSAVPSGGRQVAFAALASAACVLAAHAIRGQARPEMALEPGAPSSQAAR